MELFLTLLPYVPAIVIFLVSITFLTITWIKKLIGAKSKDEAVQATKEFFVGVVETVDSNETLLKIKEYCRNVIYEKEELFKNSTVVGKSGAFKFDSVLKEVEMECMRANFHYNAEYWKAYITEEVSKMKGVK